jgi:hypothetical protein
MESKGFTFHYHASALGLGGVLNYDKGVTKIVPSLASIGLADSGGEGFVEITNYDRDGVSFSHASGRVMGYDSGYKMFTTSSEVYITNLNLFDRVKATILQTSITSTREVGGGSSTGSPTEPLPAESPDKTSFSMHSMIRGLTIDGFEVIPQLDLELCQLPTYAEFARLGDPTKSLEVPPPNALPIRTSFVTAIDHSQNGRSPGFKLPVQTFGTLHFGELVVKPGNRNVNLLRIDFDSMLGAVQRKGLSAGKAARGGGSGPASGSPLSGTMTLLTLTGNGVPSWP